MQAVAFITSEAVDKALEASREEAVLPTGLAAPHLVGLTGRLAEAWDSIETAIRQCYEWGLERSHELVTAAVELAERVVQEAGEHGRDVRLTIQRRLQTWLTNILDAALAQVRGSVSVGQVELTLDAVDIANTVNLAGSLKANITEVCNISATGQLTVTAHYGRPS